MRGKLVDSSIDAHSLSSCDKAKLQQEILTKLKEETVQEQLAELCMAYWCDFYDIFTLATTDNHGKRPEGIANEIFSCFHHVMRGLADSKDPLLEINKAKTSHIKRATLDSYKIAINTILESEHISLEIVDYILLSDELGEHFHQTVQLVQTIKNIKADCKSAYFEAKRAEAHGEFDHCIVNYNKAFHQARNLRQEMLNLQENPLVISILAREGRRRQQDEAAEKKREAAEKKRDGQWRWQLFWTSLITLAVGWGGIAIKEYLF